LSRVLAFAAAALVSLALAGVARGALTWQAPVWIGPPDDFATFLGYGGASLAVNARGDAVIGWQLYIGTTPVAMATWRAAATTDWSGPVRLAEGASTPQVAVDSSGNALAVFDKGIVQTSYHSAGAPAWDAPITVGGHPFIGLGVGFDGSAKATAVWSEWRDPWAVAQAATRAPDGTWQQPPVDLSSPNGRVWGPAALAVDKLGDAAVAWEYVDGENHDHIQATFRPRGSSAWEPPVELADVATDAYTYTDPFVAIDDTGATTVLWGYQRGAVYSAYRPFGGRWQAARSVVPNGDPRGLAVQPDGGAVVLFTVGERSLVRATSRVRLNASWAAPVDLSTTARQAHGAALASDAHGNAIATWIEQDRWDTPETLRAALLPAASGRWEPAVDVSTNASGGYGTSVAMDGSGHAVALWDPYAAQYRPGLQVVELTGGGPILSQVAVPALGGTGVATRFSVTPMPWAAPLVGETRWDFDDGSSATGSKLRHVYSKEGTYEVRVTASATDGSSTEVRRITIAKATLANRKRPSISGVVRVGHVVQCDRGSWAGTEPIAYTYAWLRHGAALARGVRYRIRKADAGALLACRVKATNGPKTVVAVSRIVRVR
jgi:hypothetical protein